MPPLHRGAVLPLAGAIALGPASSVVAASPAAAAVAIAPVLQNKAPRCDQTQRPGKANRYQGQSASKAYDRLFRPGPSVPHLKGWVPQGLTTWRNWNGSGANLLLLGMYRSGAQSYLVGIDPTTGRHVGTVRAKATHFGALGTSRGWLIAQDNIGGKGSPPAVRRYRLASLSKQMTKAAKTGAKPYLAAHGKHQRVYGASFMAVHGANVWIGRHAKKADYMYRYTVGRGGKLRAVEGPWKVPARAQGLLVTDRHFVFTASEGGNRGRLTVVDRSAPSKAVACLWTPSLPQNLTSVGGKIYAAYESGAAKFARPGVLNRIGRLHAGSLDSLERIAKNAATPQDASRSAAHRVDRVGSLDRPAGGVFME
ncbi:MAG: hypothetical protein ACT4QG_18545 [Sporichthyaceae bacterium]